MKRFSVVMTWRQRPELARTLAANAPIFARHDVEVLVVNCGGDAGELASLLAGHDTLDLRQVDVAAETFNSSLARNIGIRRSAGRFLFFLDVDIVLTSDVFEESREPLEAEPCFVKVRTVRESSPSVDPRMSFLKEEIMTREMVCHDGRRAKLPFFRGGDGSRCGSGLLLVRRDDLLTIGGFNSNLRGWGFEDHDLQLRLQFAANLEPRAMGEVLHLSHEDEVRAVRGKSKHEDYASNMWAAYENYARGAFTGTYEADVAAWEQAAASERMTISPAVF